MESSLVVKHLNKKIGNKHIIKDLSFEVKKGEVFGFLGPNGAGKTTTIRMIVGLTTPTSGDIDIFNHPIKSERKDAMNHVGAIVENPELYPYLTGMQNLKQFARMHSSITEEDIKRTVKLVGLEQRINDKVKKYSLGMRQRLGLAQAMLHKPEILILDEPTNGLDPAGIREIRDYIRKLAKEEGMSVIVSSHLLSEMELMCDRFGIIQNGKMISIEDVNAISDREKTFTFDVFPIEKAVGILQERQLTFTERDQLITVQCNEKEVPEIVRLLASNNIDIYGIIKNKQSLEDRFLELTKGGGNIA